MSDDTYSGKWIGEYRYNGEVAGMEQIGPIRFEIEMTLNGDVLKGSCVDEETKNHFNKPTQIEGTIHDNNISFKKNYPFYWDHDDRNKARFFPKLPPRQIQFTGRFENGKFTGVWQVSSVFTDETGEVFESKNAGSWTMEKVG